MRAALLAGVALLWTGTGARGQDRVVLPAPAVPVEVRRDLTYREDGGRKLRMDVYLPPPSARSGPVPAVLFIHGGPLPPELASSPKDMGQYTSYGRLLAAAGLAAVTFEHRFTGGAEITRAAEDVRAAAEFVRENADQLSIDPGRICVWAISAGGLFVAPLLREDPERIRCVLLYYTVVNPATLTELGVPGVPEELAKEAGLQSVLTNHPAATPALFIARAGQDHPPINRELDRLAEALLAANRSLEIVNHAQGKHGFDVANDDERSREIIRRSLEFVQSSTSRR